MAKKKDKKGQDNIPEYLEQRKRSNLFTFQKYKKDEGGKKKRAKHPKLIVEEKGNTLGYMGLTEATKQGHHNNIPLTKNPKKGDTRPAHIRKEVRHDTSDNFHGPLEDYKLAKEDKKKIKEWLKQREERKKTNKKKD